MTAPKPALAPICRESSDALCLNSSTDLDAGRDQDAQLIATEQQVWQDELCWDRSSDAGSAASEDQMLAFPEAEVVPSSFNGSDESDYPEPGLANHHWSRPSASQAVQRQYPAQLRVSRNPPAAAAGKRGARGHDRMESIRYPEGAASPTGSWDSSPVHAPPRQKSQPKHAKQPVETMRRLPQEGAPTRLAPKPDRPGSSPYRQHARRTKIGTRQGNRNMSPGRPAQRLHASGDLAAGAWTGSKSQGSQLFIDLLDESKDGPWRPHRGRRKSRSEGGWDLKDAREPSTLKIQAGPLGMQLVEGMLGSASKKGQLSVPIIGCRRSSWQPS